MRYAVIGAGAVGGYFGGRLANAGRDVSFLLHSDYDYVCKNGLRVDSCRGDFWLKPAKACSATSELPQCDVVLVALKTVNNHLLPGMLRNVAGPETLVVLIQNGIGMEDDLQEAMPGLQIAAATAFICSSKTGPGHICHMDYGSLTIANYSCRDTARLDALVNELKDSGVETYTSDYLPARWRKAVWNMPFNGMTVALNTSTDELLANPATRGLIREQMLEVIGAANACGVKDLDSTFADKQLAATDRMAPYKPSMKLDYDNCRPMEIEYLYSRPIAVAAAAGYEMTRLKMLEAELKFLSAGRALWKRFNQK